MQKAKSSTDNQMSLSMETGNIIKAAAGNFMPRKEQIDAISLRLMPEIKKFFADKQTQKEFKVWKENQVK